jgi:hypothetical protein
MIKKLNVLLDSSGHMTSITFSLENVKIEHSMDHAGYLKNKLIMKRFNIIF